MALQQVVHFFGHGLIDERILHFLGGGIKRKAERSHHEQARERERERDTQAQAGPESRMHSGRLHAKSFRLTRGSVTGHQAVSHAVHVLDGVVTAGLRQLAPQHVHVAAQRALVSCSLPQTAVSSSLRLKTRFGRAMSVSRSRTHLGGSLTSFCPKRIASVCGRTTGFLQ